MITNTLEFKGEGNELISKQFKVTMSDDTDIEVKYDKAQRDAIGLIHIFHGMAEHMDRYDKLAEHLTRNGYHVLRHNHRGHGKDINENERGHFDSLEQVANDAYDIAQSVLDHDQDLPYIVLGHSMGSIIARLFVTMYPENVQGLILSGTGMFNKIKGIPTVALMKIITLLFGKKSRLDWVNRLVNRTFNKKIASPKTPSDWLSSDQSEVNRFIKDKYTGFNVSNQLIYQTVLYMYQTSRVKALNTLNNQMPILLISGNDDPFGEYGKGIRKLAKIYRQANLKQVSVKIYYHRRHEVLFEQGYERIWQDLLKWIKSNITYRK